MRIGRRARVASGPRIERHDPTWVSSTSPVNMPRKAAVHVRRGSAPTSHGPRPPPPWRARASALGGGERRLGVVGMPDEGKGQFGPLEHRHGRRNSTATARTPPQRRPGPAGRRPSSTEARRDRSDRSSARKVRAGGSRRLVTVRRRVLRPGRHAPTRVFPTRARAGRHADGRPERDDVRRAGRTQDGLVRARPILRASATRSRHPVRPNASSARRLRRSTVSVAPAWE